MTSEAPVEQLEKLFGSLRAESLRENLYALFNRPRYFYHLAAPKSCVLIGGRGSGKTTVLKCMAYEGQAALRATDFRSPNYVGLYMRINTNTVTTFKGPELTDSAWHRLFGHFINLQVCEEAARYISWLKEYISDATVDNDVDYSSVSKSLGLPISSNLNDFIDSLDDARIHLELYINNFADPKPVVSPLQTPIKELMKQLSKLRGHSNTSFYIILDEYENLLDYQQTLVNTLIKHAEGNHFFKVGVRELGWRERSTVNTSEILVSPADYERIRIEEALEDEFPEFARSVCEARLKAADLRDYGPALDVDALLPGLSIKEESILLGVESRIRDFRTYLLKSSDHPELNELHPHELYVFYELAHRDETRAIADLISYQNGEKRANEKYENYSYSLLFSISGKGSEVTKYYCGHSVLSKITYQNIRFYMQLLNTCIREKMYQDKNLSTPISPRIQTLAARRIGLSYFRELEGVSTMGGSLAKLLLGLGRVFQILAANPIGGRPECSQFDISELSIDHDPAVAENAAQLLREAVMQLALVRTPGTKLVSDFDIRSWDYAPHPIFAPYFGFSHRRKRKMTVAEADIINITQKPQATIKKLLGRRSSLADTSLPDQMSMFDEYFR